MNKPDTHLDAENTLMVTRGEEARGKVKWVKG